jgi:uncharacterized protein (TIGR03067 family)
MTAHILTLILALSLASHPNLEGNWQATHAELAGKALSSSVTQTIVLKLSAGEYKVRNDFGTVRYIDDSKMEITGTQGPNKDKTFKAIYEITGDRLVICYDLSGKSFPASFSSKEGSAYFLVTYSRTK